MLYAVIKYEKEMLANTFVAESGLHLFIQKKLLVYPNEIITRKYLPIY